jgi:hypothetical protein
MAMQTNVFENKPPCDFVRNVSIYNVTFLDQIDLQIQALICNFSLQFCSNEANKNSFLNSF